MNNELKIVDLFSGCGGFGLGAELAGFKSVVAVDIEANLQSAYSRNFPETRTILSDIAQMDSESWGLILNKQQIDGVIGGPPCQGYSRMGHSDKTDPRRTLLAHFFRTINIIKPKFFVMENVEGLLDDKNRYELDAALEIIDPQYEVLQPIVVNALDYGAPTSRKRVIVVGYMPEFVSDIDETELIPANPKRTTVGEAILDINEPIPQTKDKADFGWTTYRTDSGLSEYARRMRSFPPKNLGDPEMNNKLFQGLVSGNFDTRHTPTVRERYKSLKQGQIDRISKAKKLELNGFCPTLRAGTGSDKGSHQAVRPIHPNSGRVITVREAARLQGFPDWFSFHTTKWHSFRMIGNSVSPLVSQSILGLIKSRIMSEQSIAKVI
ncbi:DNA cytosine methyltransferase [Vibrio parahaemolyticus]|uniref:DNA cytosine methyltransferase n=1 Tax=Vibrio parahaemolyticus TaxID=670 RepID=UPI0004D6195C|nr:DNA cytosine methyltransferase [Vibrio parahaemolyticus]EGQ9981063.1 DNA cytosine methyltransferase [Vibrio parahaemolyticus]EGR0905477.1 DNA cytosine methyltransferase [Vibrio parahaemolyticus]EHD6031465.1 DNA cytosine methyltransferase [Vibrio parahaemolyticus]EJR0957812.1 DNA cytosine methyltransferase [Vibrio parahaemolyticus]EKA7393748.1 DNA cytosine methyltransferase [Vibrio parahaemolyticus]